MAIMTNPVQLAFKNPGQLTLSETKQIKSTTPLRRYI